jgi:hypothetical protein
MVKIVLFDTDVSEVIRAAKAESRRYSIDLA